MAQLGVIRENGTPAQSVFGAGQADRTQLHRRDDGVGKIGLHRRRGGPSDASPRRIGADLRLHLGEGPADELCIPRKDVLGWVISVLYSPARAPTSSCEKSPRPRRRIKFSPKRCTVGGCAFASICQFASPRGSSDPTLSSPGRGSPSSLTAASGIAAQSTATSRKPTRPTGIRSWPETSPGIALSTRRSPREAGSPFVSGSTSQLR